ncbi:MAG: hypothetical protein F6K14_31060, partial [Symploca sp. SIO2C1]|nr:hypothetical protein [Symploca sp. SIO2C1]
AWAERLRENYFTIKICVNNTQIFIFVIFPNEPANINSICPRFIETGEDWPTNLPLSFKDSVQVFLVDDDLAGDDSLGEYTYFPGDPEQPHEQPVSGHGGEYILFTEPAN